MSVTLDGTERRTIKVNAPGFLAHGRTYRLAERATIRVQVARPPKGGALEPLFRAWGARWLDDSSPLCDLDVWIVEDERVGRFAVPECCAVHVLA